MLPTFNKKIMGVLYSKCAPRLRRLQPKNRKILIAFQRYLNVEKPLNIMKENKDQAQDGIPVEFYICVWDDIKIIFYACLIRV